MDAWLESDDGTKSGRQKTSGRASSRILGCSSRKRIRTDPKVDESVVRPERVSEVRDESCGGREAEDGDGLIGDAGDLRTGMKI